MKRKKASLITRDLRLVKKDIKTGVKATGRGIHKIGKAFRKKK